MAKLATIFGSRVEERSYRLQPSTLNKEKRTVRVQFSSEAPVKRWYRSKSGQMFEGLEVLDHSPESVDMRRINSGTAVLLEHDMSDRIGITEDNSGTITSNRTGEAVIRFARTPKGDSALNEVEDGTLRWVSVGYEVNRVVPQDDPNAGPDDLVVMRAVQWEPLELTLTGVPRDRSTRVYRSSENPEREIEIDTSKMLTRNVLFEADPPSGGGGAASPPAPAPQPPSAPAIVSSDLDREKKRSDDIYKIAANIFKSPELRSKHPNIYDEADRARQNGESADSFGHRMYRTTHDNQPLNPPLEDRSLAPSQDDIESWKRGDREPWAPNGRQFRSLGHEIVGSKQWAERQHEFKRSSFDVVLDFPNLSFTRATLTTSVSGLTAYERPPGVVLVEQQPLLVADLFAQGSTNQTSIRYMREDTWTNLTAAAAALAEEGTYQELSWDLSEQDVPIRKVGALGRITDEMLEDSDTIASYFNSRIPFAVMQRVDQYLLNGLGTGNQITGILVTAGIQTEAFSGTSLDTIHRAITKVRSVGFYPPDAIIMHPTDYQNARLAKDSNNQYFSGGPFVGQYGAGASATFAPLWGLPVIVTTAIAQGKALVGAFRLGAQLWRKAGVSIQIQTTNSDASDFANGRVAVRASERLGLAVYRPLAFCQCTGLI